MTMSTASTERSYRQFRAPRASGAALVEPSFDSVSSLLADNHQRRSVEFRANVASGAEWTRAQLISTARRELVQLATDYTSTYRKVLPSTEFETMIMSGHQPTLFHPGVWFKNFALSQLAVAHDAVAIHLIVDNDSVASPSMEAPARTNNDSIIRANVPLDEPGSNRPYEEWAIRDRALFDAAGEQIANHLAPLVNDPLISQLWPSAMSAANRHGNLGLALSQARHQLEGECGLQTLELPVSQMSDTDSFRRFLACILLNADSFRAIYNEEIQRFRAAHKIRSQAHPVPLLNQVDGWTEVPYWNWTEATPARKALYVRVIADQIELRSGWNGQVYVGPIGHESLPAWLAELRQQGVKIRPRALTMTMYVRLILSDLFLHGIGGAKYDELGDAIIESFFGVEPPHYMTLSATVLLPLGTRQVDRDDIRQLDGCLRDLWFHPERHVDLESAKCLDDVRKLAERKQALVESPPPHGNRKVWHAEIALINEQMRVHVLETREILLEEHQSLTEQLRGENALRSREFSFSLFPITRLKQLLLDLSSPSR